MDPNQPQTPSATVDEIDVDIEYQVSLNLSACDPGGYGLNFTDLPLSPRVSLSSRLHWLVPSSGTPESLHTVLVSDSSSSSKVELQWY